MVVPFGVSVDDFIASIKLVHDLADGLKASCTAPSDFRDLNLRAAQSRMVPNFREEYRQPEEYEIVTVR
jgi:hypothetical protein